MSSNMKTILSTGNGFTLLEVLITVVVFSVGLLGLAGLQVKSLKLAQDSFSRTVATMLAEEMADRMRANRSATALGLTSAYNNPVGNSAGNPSCLGKDSSGNLIDTTCSANEMAQHDFYEWYSRIQGQSATTWHPAQVAQLPSANGIVCIDLTPNDGTPGNPQCDNLLVNPNIPIFTIKVWWIERKLDATNNLSLHSHVTTVAL